MLTLSGKFEEENNKGVNSPSLLVKVQQDINEFIETTETDWGNNTSELNVDYTPPVPASGDVQLVGGEDFSGVWSSAATGRSIWVADGYEYNGKIYYLTITGSNAVFEIYDIAGDSWDAASSQHGTAHSYFGNPCIVGIGDKIYIFAGTEGLSTECGYYDIGANTWTFALTNFPFSRCRGIAVAWDGDNFVYVSGGGDTSGVSGRLYRYSISGDSWLRLADLPTILNHHVMEFYNGKLYIYGGSEGTTTDSDKLHIYDIDGDSWSSFLSQAPGHLRYLSSLVVSSFIFFLGGYNGSAHQNKVWRYDITNNTWLQVTSFATIRSRFGSAYSNGKMYIYGGLTTGTSEIGLIGFVDSGHIQTKNIDLGSAPTVNGEWVLLDIRPSDSVLSYQAWASSTGLWAGEETDLGIIEDGDLITVLERYYRVKVTFTVSSDNLSSPVLNAITLDFATYKNYAEDLTLHREPNIISVSSISTTIDIFKKSTIGQITLTMDHTASVSTWLAANFPVNKKVAILSGFIADGYTEGDYIDYFYGQLDDYDIDGDDKVNLYVHDYAKKWSKVSVPLKWESGSDDVVWTSMHPIDVLLDLFKNYVNIRDSNIDTSSFQTVKTQTLNWQVTRTITNNPEDAENLINELRILLSCFFVPQADGRIKIKRWDPSEPAVANLTDEIMSRDTKYKGNAKSIINRSNIYYDHKGSTFGDDASDFNVYNLAVDASSQANWDDEISKTIKDKWTDTAQGSQITDLETNIINRYADKPSIITTTLDRRWIDLEAGDIVSVTTARAPSIDMTGISDVNYQIINRTLNHGKDTIGIILLEVAP